MMQERRKGERGREQGQRVAGVGGRGKEGGREGVN